MTPLEFNEWLGGYMRVFPDFKAWFNDLGPDDRIGLQEEWAQALEDVELRDARAVTSRIVCGDDAPVQPFERELTAAHIRRLAKENASRRRDREERQRRTEPGTRCHGSGPGAGELYTRMLALMDENPGLTAQQAAEQVMPPADDRGGPRYDCWLCRDTGIVLVWSSVSIRAAAAGELHLPHNRKVCGAPCRCRAGDNKVWRNSGDPPRGWSGWRNPDAVYSEERYCACPDGDTESEKAIEDFKEWVAIRIIEAEKRGRVSDFDDWNSGGKENAIAN